MKIKSLTKEPDAALNDKYFQRRYQISTFG